MYIYIYLYYIFKYSSSVASHKMDMNAVKVEPETSRDPRFKNLLTINQKSLASWTVFKFFKKSEIIENIERAYVMGPLSAIIVTKKDEVFLLQPTETSNMKSTEGNNILAKKLGPLCGKNIVELYSHECNYFAALTKSGTLYVWGSNIPGGCIEECVSDEIDVDEDDDENDGDDSLDEDYDGDQENQEGSDQEDQDDQDDQEEQDDQDDQGVQEDLDAQGVQEQDSNSEIEQFDVRGLESIRITSVACCKDFIFAMSDKKMVYISGELSLQINNTPFEYKSKIFMPATLFDWMTVDGISAGYNCFAAFSKGGQIDLEASSLPVKIPNENIENKEFLATSEVEMDADDDAAISLFDPSSWPQILNEENRNRILQSVPNFESTFTFVPVNGHKFSGRYFTGSKKNGESYFRDWLRFSKISNSAFCLPCCFFSSKSGNKSPWSNWGVGNIGFQDLKHAKRGVEDHEDSLSHFDATRTWKCFLKNVKDPTSLTGTCVKTYDENINHWRLVLQSFTSDVNANALSRLRDMLNYKFLLGITIWNQILFQINICNLNLQDKTIDVSIAKKKLNVLKTWLENFKETGFQSSEVLAQQIAENMGIEMSSGFENIRQGRGINPRYMDRSDALVAQKQTNYERFEADFFDKLMEKLISEISRRFDAFKKCTETFEFLWGGNPKEMEIQEKQKCMQDLCHEYPSDFSGPTLLNEVICGRLHFIALCENGDLYVWGNNSFSQLGNKAAKPAHYPVPLKFQQPVKDICSHPMFNLSVCEAGNQLYLWGIDQATRPTVTYFKNIVDPFKKLCHAYFATILVARARTVRSIPSVSPRPISTPTTSSIPVAIARPIPVATQVTADLFFIVDGVTIAGHRDILIRKSGFFKCLLEAYQTNETEIVIPDIEHTTFDAYIFLVYTGKLNCRKSNVKYIMGKINIIF
ncbi:RCC1 and BTB domain-containing protein 1 [Folsomia candida]|uniref:RCC1 and BTB domain-containing protein 1 n=1 Tax=Folsomia candida TaxID=158441 RepID=A0A226DWB2_FOLCA|nr:RCC1 and BTB domain-containing protein 1 [Folsomia candida]